MRIRHNFLPVLAVGLLLSCCRPATGQITAQDIIGDLMPISGAGAAAAAGGWNGPAPRRHTTLGNPTGGPAASGAAANVIQQNATATAPSGGTEYVGEWATESKTAFTDFFEDVSMGVLVMHAMSNNAVVRRGSKVTAKAPKMRMRIQGGQMRIDPIVLDINMDAAARMSDGDTETTKVAMRWSYQFGAADFHEGISLKGRMNVTCIGTEKNNDQDAVPIPKQTLPGSWVATPVSRGRYSVVLVFDARNPDLSSVLSSASAAFSQKPESWDRVARMINGAAEQAGVLIPLAPRDGVPRWTLEPVGAPGVMQTRTGGQSQGGQGGQGGNGQGGYGGNNGGSNTGGLKLLDELNKGQVVVDPEEEKKRQRREKKDRKKTRDDGGKPGVGFAEGEEIERKVRIKGPIPDNPLDLLDVKTHPDE